MLLQAPFEYTGEASGATIFARVINGATLEFKNGIQTSSANAAATYPRLGFSGDLTNVNSSPLPVISNIGNVIVNVTDGKFYATGTNRNELIISAINLTVNNTATSSVDLGGQLYLFAQSTLNLKTIYETGIKP